jgi:hypothetical protein
MSLAGYARDHAGEGWRRVAVKLSCFSAEIDVFERVTTPFMLEATRTGDVSLADIRFPVSGEATLDCPD